MRYTVVIRDGKQVVNAVAVVADNVQTARKLCDCWKLMGYTPTVYPALTDDNLLECARMIARAITRKVYSKTGGNEQIVRELYDTVRMADNAGTVGENMIFAIVSALWEGYVKGGDVTAYAEGYKAGCAVMYGERGIHGKYLEIRCQHLDGKSIAFCRNSGMTSADIRSSIAWQALRDAGLTQTEKQTLLLFADGYTVTQIAELQGKNKSVISRTLYRAREKASRALSL